MYYHDFEAKDINLFKKQKHCIHLFYFHYLFLIYHDLLIYMKMFNNIYHFFFNNKIFLDKKISYLYKINLQIIFQYIYNYGIYVNKNL